MKKLTIMIASILFSFSAIALAEDPKVQVSVDTPVGSVDVNKPPPPQPVVVVQPPAQPKTVVVEKQVAPPPAPSGGCSCGLLCAKR